MDNAIDIPIGTSSFELTFSENIALANGNFYVELLEEGVSKEIQSVGDSHISNNVLSLSFNYSLGYAKEYNILLPANAIKAATSTALYSGLAAGEWSFTTESSPPLWANGFPSVSGQNSAKFDLNALADVTGIVYGVVTGAAAQPSVAQIVAGQNSSSGPAKIARNASVTSIVTPTPVEFLFNDDTPTGVNYYLHTVFEKDGKYSTVETITIDRIIPEINQLTSLPLNGDFTVAVDESVTIVFKEPVFGFDGSGTLPLDNTYFSFQYDDSGTPIDVAFTFSQTTTSEQTTVVLQPDVLLLQDEEYTVTIAPVSDASGNLTNQIVRTFETDKENVWIGGGVVTTWNDPLNWSSGTYAPGKTVTIPIGSTAFPEITSGTIDVHNLTIEPGASLTHTGGTLNVTGLFTLQSSVAVNASYINNGAVGTVLNVVGSNVNVEQVIDNINMTYLISSPTDGSTALSFGNYYPLYTYNNTTDAWDAISSGATMAPGVGYRMWTDDSMVGFSGEINTGAFLVNLTRTNGAGYGWNLVGNPYPASIDWTLLGINESSTIENNFWIWMPTQRAYGAYSASTDIPINITSSKIPSNHAFLVKVKIGEPTGSIEFVPDAQVANDANYLKSGTTKPVVDYIKLAGVTSNNVKDEMAVAFIDEASTAFDRFDLEKRFANRDHLFELFSLAESMKTSINAIPLNGTYEVPLGFNALKTGDFSIEMVMNKAENVETILVDKLEATEIALLPGDRYDFSVASKGLNTSRFSLKFFKVSTDLPIESISFNRSNVFVQGREVFISVPSEIAGSEYRVNDFSGRLIQTGTLRNDGVNSLGQFVEGSYIINIIGTSNAALENHKVVVY
ncbi:Ig-like domain-containing protein [Geofilum rubicundum]|uniref:SbsA Ig-like domain-containing protein n=1 Tax=Geofilum rubicundum JCM 15548 TaxID=1236989 RepID=A0A0E9LUG4_9BACT|nr:Ig-like domain-containing protein [Geofilum rubicundum]GAO28923.1 hypothetical protein JCM15548_11065 [Geofilum rubicundum JCM 15548]